MTMHDDEAKPAVPAGATTTPIAVGQTGGVPVGVVGELGNPSGQPAAAREPDPAEAEFERLTGHKTDERPTTSSDDAERGPNG